jgi:hypothetical protein
MEAFLYHPAWKLFVSSGMEAFLYHPAWKLFVSSGMEAFCIIRHGSFFVSSFPRDSSPFRAKNEVADSGVILLTRGIKPAHILLSTVLYI